MKFFLIVAVFTTGLAAFVSSLSETATTVQSLSLDETTTETTLLSGPPATAARSDSSPADATLISDPPPATLVPRAGADLRVDDETAAPARIRVERLGIDLDVLSVGVDERGDFDVPSSGIGWYQHGSAPGETGSAVLAAHVDYGGAPGAFFHLETLVPGDVIEIDLTDGSSLAYEVIEQVLYDKTALPADELFDRTGTPLLRLITCGGAFDPNARSYLGNRVVTARPLAEAPG